MEHNLLNNSNGKEHLEEIENECTVQHMLQKGYIILHCIRQVITY